MSKSIYWERAARIALIVLLLSLVGATNAWAQNFTVGNLNYSVNDDGGTVTVTGHVNGEDAIGELVIPGTVVNNGFSYTVTAIGGYAFYNCSGFTGTLTIPNSVTFIDEVAFCGCSGFTGSLIIPNSVTFIGDWAFENCSGLTTIEIPNSLTSIAYGAFYYCTGLTSVEIPNSVISIGGYAFFYCYGLQSLTVLSETPPAMGSYVFYGANMNIPVYVPCEAEGAYINEGWGGFNNIVGMCPCELSVMANPIEGGTVSGGDTFVAGSYCTITATANEGYAFANWTIDGYVVSTDAEYTFPLTGTVTLVANFASTDDNIVFADENVKYICISNWDTNGDGELSYAEAAVVTDLGEAFQYHSDITSFDELQYFTSLTAIGFCAFQYCGNLTSVIFPSSLISFANFALVGCHSLTNVTIPKFVTFIGAQVFSYCYGLESLIVESGNTVYDSREGCNAIIETASNTLVIGCKNTIIPNSVTSIGWYAFAGCWGLTSIVIPNSITSIGIGVLVNCDGLESIVVESGNTVYDSRENCNAIIETASNTLVNGCKNTTIPSSVTSIGEKAFSGCNGLTSIMIPSAVTFMGFAAFEECYGLQSITVLPETPPALDWYVFPDVNMDIPIFVSCGLEDVYYGWGGFNNIVGMCPGEVTVMANTAEGGTVSGGGTFVAGSYCTVTAMANESYAFANWTIGGRVVSTNAEYTFPVSGTVTLMANFVSSIDNIVFADDNVKAICVANWDTNGDGELSYAEAATVTDLGGAFQGNWNITSFNELQYFISLTTIGYGAFQYCSNLTSVIFPQSLVSIENFAFGCTNLTTITIPRYVTSIGVQVFSYGYGLECIIVESGNSVYDSREGCNAIIETASNTLVVGCKNTTIPNTVTSIGNYAFNGCYGLTAIEIPNSVMSIEFNAFSYCNNLQSLIMLSETPPVLGWYVFSNVNMDIPVYVPCGAVDAYIIEDWGGFNNFVGMCPCEVTVMANPAEGGTVSGGGIHNAGTYCTLTATANEGYAFANWIVDGHVVSTDAEYDFFVPGTVTVVANFASTDNIIFADVNVKSICVTNWDTNGDGELSYAEAAVVTDLGGAFQYHSEITSFDELQYFISLTTIGSYEFYHCRNMTSFIFPNSLTSIAYNAFWSCRALTSVTIPKSVISIGTGIFVDCNGLESIIVESGNTAYDSRVGCNAIIVTATNDLIAGCKNTIIPNSVTSIDEYAFAGCSGLASINFPNSITSIGWEAFHGCSALSSVTIPNSVTSIGEEAFGFCNGLESLIVESGNAVYDSREGCNAIIETASNTLIVGCKNTIIPNSVTSIYHYAFEGSYDLTSIEIPNTVSYIGHFAFSYCGLQSMTVLSETPPTLDWYVFYGVNMDIPVFVPCGNAEAYQSAEGWNEFPNIYELCAQSQTNTLASGWNWWSTYLDITLDELKETLVDALPGTSITIKSRTQNTAYNPNTHQWRGTLNAFNVTQMYMIYVSTDCEITLTGTPINPAEHPVTINNGSNWIAFPLAESMTVSNAFAGFAINGDKVKSRNNNSQYIGGSWRGQLTTLVPGQGYMYISNSQEPRTFTFPANTTKSACLERKKDQESE